MIAKSTTIKGRVVNPAGVRGRRSILPREISGVSGQSRTERVVRPVIATEKSAEGIVGHDVGETGEALRTERRSNR